MDSFEIKKNHILEYAGAWRALYLEDGHEGEWDAYLVQFYKELDPKGLLKGLEWYNPETMALRAYVNEIRECGWYMATTDRDYEVDSPEWHLALKNPEVMAAYREADVVETTSNEDIMAFINRIRETPKDIIIKAIFQSASHERLVSFVEWMFVYYDTQAKQLQAELMMSI